MIVITDVCFLFEKSNFGWNWSDSASGLLKTETGRKSAAILIFQCVIVDVVSSPGTGTNKAFFKCKSIIKTTDGIVKAYSSLKKVYLLGNKRSRYFISYKNLIGYKYLCLTKKPPKNPKTSNCASSVGKTHSFQFISSLQLTSKLDWESAQKWFVICLTFTACIHVFVPVEWSAGQKEGWRCAEFLF